MRFFAKVEKGRVMFDYEFDVGLLEAKRQVHTDVCFWDGGPGGKFGVIRSCPWKWKQHPVHQLNALGSYTSGSVGEFFVICEFWRILTLGGWGIHAKFYFSASSFRQHALPCPEPLLSCCFLLQYFVSALCFMAPFSARFKSRILPSYFLFKSLPTIRRCSCQQRWRDIDMYIGTERRLDA